ncbi:hypothetical protein HY439_01335 [Candidatus Microgenomates bacterium]|nr:hypothetical protein [Candidatus Microgenomates bacterium]
MTTTKEGYNPNSAGSSSSLAGLTLHPEIPEKPSDDFLNGWRRFKTKPPEIDLSKGNFWQTELGAAAKEFVFAQTDRPKTTVQVAKKLRLKGGKESSHFIMKLVRSGIIVGAEKAGGRGYRLPKPQMIICALVLRDLEDGLSLPEIVSHLSQKLEGTDLKQFVGEAKENYDDLKPGVVFFTETSPWYQKTFECMTVTDSQGTLGGEDKSLISQNVQPDTEEIDEEDLPEFKPKSPLDKIIEIDEEQLAELEKIDPERLKKIYGRAPDNSLETFNLHRLNAIASEKLPFSVVKTLLFIHLVRNRHLRPLDEKLDDLTFADFRRTAQTCLRIFDDYPHLQNLAQLYKYLRQAVEENPTRFMEPSRY